MRTLVFLFLLPITFCYTQIDKEQLALAVSKADAANTEQLKTFIWKRHSTATVNGEDKATVITEFSFNAAGEIQTNVVGHETSVKKKPGLRGKAQENAIEDKMEYVQNALELSLKYIYMSKGELLDFFEKATVTEKDGIVEATAENVKVKGDKLAILIDAKTNLFIHKKFSSLLGKDPIDGEIKYETFSSGINHASAMFMNLPVQKAKIDAKNQDYSQRIN